MKRCAGDAGLTLTAYVKNRILDRPVTAQVDRKFLNLVQKLGCAIISGLSEGRYEGETEIELRKNLAMLTEINEVFLRRMKEHGKL